MVEGANLFDITGTLTEFAGEITGQVATAGPVIAGVVVSVAGLTIGLKYLKKFTAKL